MGGRLGGLVSDVRGGVVKCTDKVGQVIWYAVEFLL